jgi:predicted enzyme related to lactoylglutathione lyase
LVEDAEATEAAVVAGGGQVFAPTMTVGDQGRLAVVADPGGAAVGLWQAAEHRGYGLAAEVGSVVWHELNARDFDAQVGFYSDVFGWRPALLSDTEEFRYVTFGPSPENPVGGVYDAAAVLPPGMPSSWLVYFGVADVDASAARVTELGGAVVREPWDSEFGRFCQVTDATGGFFVLSSVTPG